MGSNLAAADDDGVSSSSPALSDAALFQKPKVFEVKKYHCGWATYLYQSYKSNNYTNRHQSGPLLESLKKKTTKNKTTTTTTTTKPKKQPQPKNIGAQKSCPFPLSVAGTLVGCGPTLNSAARRSPRAWTRWRTGWVRSNPKLSSSEITPCLDQMENWLGAVQP